MGEVLIDRLGEPGLLALIGLFGGALLGLAARLGRFCTLGAIEDALYGASTIRLRMWGVAIGTAIIGSFCLALFAGFDPTESFYLRAGWNPIAHAVGGLLFGYGMAMTGNCGYGALARLGGGDMRAFIVVLVMGVASYAALSGPLAPLRMTLFPTDLVDMGGPSGLAHMLGGADFALLLGVAIGVAVLLGSLAHRGFAEKYQTIFWGVVVGLAIVSGWAGTSWVAENGFEPTVIRSHTYAAPLGETLHYGMLGSAVGLSFGIGSVMGVIGGAVAGSLFKGHFRWEGCEDPRELRRQIGGAVLMGFGAAIAIGCSVGQGLSAISLLSLGAPITLIGIFGGAAIGLRHMIEGLA